MRGYTARGQIDTCDPGFEEPDHDKAPVALATGAQFFGTMLDCYLMVSDAGGGGRNTYGRASKSSHFFPFICATPARWYFI